MNEKTPARSRHQCRNRVFMRVLLMVDVLAASHRGMTAGQVTERINELAGETYSSRTIRRDLDAFHILGFVHREDRKLDRRFRPTIYWTLNLKRSERLQEVAFEMVEAN